MNPDILARIDAALAPQVTAQRFMSPSASVWSMSTDEIFSIIDALTDARAEIVRLAALIPEQPTGDEREALAVKLESLNEEYERDTLGKREPLIDEAVTMLRNRGRGPITDEWLKDLVSELREMGSSGSARDDETWHNGASFVIAKINTALGAARDAEAGQ